jgi:tetratricopeptide (TPR) repeat protein
VARKEVEPALERYAEAERLDRDGRYRFLVQMNRGVMRYGRLEYADAVRHYEAALAATTAPRDRAIVDLNWGNCLRDRADSQATPDGRCEDLRSAVERYRRSIDLQPRDSRALAGLGTALHRLGRRAEAERSLRLAIQVDPAFLDSYVNLGSVLLDMGRPTEAEQVLRAAIARAPESSDAWSLLGQALMDQERAREAVGATRRARELLPQSVHATIAYARALREAGRPGEALEVLGAIPSRHADMERGKARCALRQKAEAEGFFREALDDRSTRTYAEVALDLLREPRACRSATPDWDAPSKRAPRRPRECDSSAR